MIYIHIPLNGVKNKTKPKNQKQQQQKELCPTSDQKFFSRTSRENGIIFWQVWYFITYLEYTFIIAGI